MFCNDFKVLWQSMVDGELVGDVERGAREHLAQCAECAIWARSMDALENALEAVGEVEHEAPSFLSTRIMANLEALAEHAARSSGIGLRVPGLSRANGPTSQPVPTTWLGPQMRWHSAAAA